MYCQIRQTEHITHTVFLALGTNLGDRRTNLATALARLRLLVDIERISSIYETEPVGYLQQPRFFNLVLCGQSQLSAQELLRASKEIEADLGRLPSFRNAPRTIDIDILIYDDVQIREENLIVPHPRMHERAFVLIPLKEIAPEMIVPGRGQTVHELAMAIPSEGVKRITSSSTIA